MGSDESHFNIPLIVRDKVTRQCPETTIFEAKGEPKADSKRGPSVYQPNALPLTGEEQGELINIANTILPPPKRFCISMGGDESQFNVSLTASGKITRQRQ